MLPVCAPLQPIRLLRDIHTDTHTYTHTCTCNVFIHMTSSCCDGQPCASEEAVRILTDHTHNIQLPKERLSKKKPPIPTIKPAANAALPRAIL